MVIKGIDGACSRRPASNLENDGWRMINEGAESDMVYCSSLSGWDVPVRMREL